MNTIINQSDELTENHIYSQPIFMTVAVFYVFIRQMNQLFISTFRIINLKPLITLNRMQRVI